MNRLPEMTTNTHHTMAASILKPSVSGFGGPGSCLPGFASFVQGVAARLGVEWSVAKKWEPLARDLLQCYRV